MTLLVCLFQLVAVKTTRLSSRLRPHTSPQIVKISQLYVLMLTYCSSDNTHVEDLADLKEINLVLRSKGIFTFTGLLSDS